jgi:hypothetical protein
MQIRPARPLSDGLLEFEFLELCANDRGNTAQLLVHLAEIDRRRLYIAAGYSSMFKYCVDKGFMSEEVAYRRIRVARAARHHPKILAGIADGRLNLTTVVFLAPHLTSGNAAELLTAASHQPKSGVELLIARRFPREDLPTRIEPARCQKLAPEPVQNPLSAISATHTLPVNSLVITPASLEAAQDVPSSRIAPLTPERFGLQTTIDRETNDDLNRAQELLGHVSQSQVPEVLKRALRLYVTHLEKQKLAAVSKPRLSGLSHSRNPRHIPAFVKRVVRERDKDRCTFVAENGRRCEERSGLEFDHIEPVARGGRAMVGNIRLRCRAHNQYEAERVFGASFMEGKRDTARRTSVPASG